MQLCIILLAISQIYMSIRTFPVLGYYVLLTVFTWYPLARTALPMSTVRRMRYYCNFEFIANVIRLQEYNQYMDIGTFCSVFSYETRSHCVPSAWAFKVHNSERMNTYIHISIINLLYFCRNNIYIKDKNCLIFEMPGCVCLVRFSPIFVFI